MIKIKEAIIVEGKYDKMKLQKCVDAIIIETGGFRICKDIQKLNLIKKLANKTGIIIITDSDSAGFFIRNYIRSAVPKEKIKHVYIPEIYGKERRKAHASKEGKLGLEGLDCETIEKALKKARVLDEDKEIHREKIKKYDLYRDGIYGRENSAVLREKILDELSLPRYLSTSALLEVLNTILSLKEYKSLIEKITTQ